MAEEDVLFGKRRHLYGGLEPSNMITFLATSSVRESDNAKVVKITAKLPKDTVIEGNVLCSVAGAVIRKSTTGYPKDEFSGTEVANITKDDIIIDDDVVVGQTYYYAVFPYSKLGVYNRSKVNRASTKVYSYTYLFGYDLDISDSDPDTRVSYPADVMNESYAPASMNYTTSVFNYGSWPSEAGVKFMPKPCMLQFNGTVVSYLNPNDYTKTVDGADSNVGDLSYVQGTDSKNAMMEWPKIYTHREVVNGVYKFRCSDVKVDDSWDCWCNYDANNNEIDHFYMSIYPGTENVQTITEGSGTTTARVLRSISGYKPSRTRTPAEVWDSAKYNSLSTTQNGWKTDNIFDRLLIQDLLVMMSKSTNTQDKFGHGNVSSGTSGADFCINNGSLNTKGLFWGASTLKSAVKVFGMENWWGNTRRLLSSIDIFDGTIKLMHPHVNDGKYFEIGIPTITDDISGFITNTVNTPYGRVPYQSTNGSSTTYECNYMYYRSSNPYFTAGEYYGTGSGAGAFSIRNMSSGSTQEIGSGLSFKLKID